MTDTQTNTMITDNLSMEDFYANQPFDDIICPMCGKIAKAFTQIFLTTYPAQYSCHCQHCGHYFYTSLLLPSQQKTKTPVEKLFNQEIVENINFNNFTKQLVLECDKFVVKDKTLGIELTIPDISVFDSISINGIIYERKSK